MSAPARSTSCVVSEPAPCRPTSRNQPEVTSRTPSRGRAPVPPAAAYATFTHARFRLDSTTALRIRISS